MYLRQYFRCLEFLHPSNLLASGTHQHEDDENENTIVKSNSAATYMTSECHPRGSLDPWKTTTASGGMKLGSSASPKSSTPSTVHIDLAKSQSSRQRSSSFSDPFTQLGIAASPLDFASSTVNISINRQRGSRHDSNNHATLCNNKLLPNPNSIEIDFNPKFLQKFDEDATTNVVGLWAADDDELNGLEC